METTIVPNSTNFLRDTVDLVRQIETRFLELGARLFQIRQNEIWKGTHDSFQEFLDSAKISKGNASMLAAIHKAYVVDGGVSHERLSKVGYSNLYAAIPLIEAEGIDNTVEKARLLTRDEIKQEVREEAHPDCKHPEFIEICTTCHKRLE